MGRLIALTAKIINGQTPRKPRVVYLQEDAIKTHTRSKSGGPGTRVVEKLANETNDYIVFEKGMHIEAARNLSSTDILVKQHIALALAGVGTTQGAGTVLTKYFNEATAIAAGVTEAFVLPAATVGKVCVIANNDADAPAKVFPAVGEFINDQAVNTVYSIPLGTTVHFVCPTTAGKWVVADDFGR